MVALLIQLLIQLAGGSPGPCDTPLMHPTFAELSIREAAQIMGSGR